MRMFEKIKKFLGAGREQAAALVRDVIRGHEQQSALFEPENEQALKAFVEYGHSFSPHYFPTFLQVADHQLIKTYLEMGFGLSEKEVKAVLDLKDDELTKVMIDTGSWCPLPYGNALGHPASKHHELDQYDVPEGSRVSPA